VLAVVGEAGQDRQILEPPLVGERPILRVMERSPEVVLDELLVLEAQGGDARALVSMFYWDQLPLAEIAHILNIPLGTVKSRLHHARHDLKQMLERSKP